MVICQASVLIGIYLCVVATPLSTIYYCRCAPLAGMDYKPPNGSFDPWCCV